MLPHLSGGNSCRPELLGISERKRMGDLIERTFFTILGGFIAGAIGVLISDRNRRRDACQQFLSIMSDLYGESLEARDHGEFHGRTLDRVRKAVFQVRPFLSKKRVVTLEWLWDKYRKVNWNSLSPEAGWLQEFRRRFPDEEDQPNDPSKTISLYIQKFCDLAC